MISKRYALLRYATISLGVISGFAQIYWFVRYLAPENLAFVVLISGYGVFLNLVDAGLSKPAYADLRAGFIQRLDQTHKIRGILTSYLLLSAVVLTLFCIATLILSVAIPNKLSLSVVILLGLTLATGTSTNFFRDVLRAVDQYEYFEKTELLRRGANIAATSLVIIDSSLFMTVTTQALIFILIYAHVVWRTLRASNGKLRDLVGLSVSHASETFLRYWPDTKNYLAFMVNETLLYNGGYLIVPAYLDYRGVIIFGVWMRIYSGMTLITRAVSDITIHVITQYFFNGNVSMAQRLLIKSAWLSVGLAAGLTLTFVALHDSFMTLWVSGKYSFDTLMFVGLGTFLCANALQHVMGTFLVSIGEHFRILRNISIVATVGVLGSFLGTLHMTRQLGMSLVATSCAYACSAGIHAFVAQKTLRRARNA